MSKKKGLSIEEKIVKVEEYFHQHQVPFTMKELMVVIPKAKGVIYQSVEECVELLVSENRVQCEKIGVSTFYWYFEVSSTDKAAAKCDSLKQKKATLSTQLLEKTRQCSQGWAYLGLSERFDPSTVLTSLSLKQLDEYRAQLLEINELIHSRKQSIESLADQDPHITERLAEIRNYAHGAVNRWTDNVFLLEEAVCKSISVSRCELRSAFGTPSNLQYLPQL